MTSSVQLPVQLACVYRATSVSAGPCLPIGKLHACTRAARLPHGIGIGNECQKPSAHMQNVKGRHDQQRERSSAWPCSAATSVALAPALTAGLPGVIQRTSRHVGSGFGPKGLGEACNAFSHHRICRHCPRFASSLPRSERHYTRRSLFLCRAREGNAGAVATPGDAEAGSPGPALTTFWNRPRGRGTAMPGDQSPSSSSAAQLPSTFVGALLRQVALVILGQNNKECFR